jgi:porin
MVNGVSIAQTNEVEATEVETKITGTTDENTDETDETTDVESAAQFSLSYIVDALTNVSGGLEQGSDVLGSLLLELSVDAEKAFGLTGGSFTVGVLGIHGGPFSDRVGDYQTVSNIEAPKTVNLLTAFYEQMFLDDRLSISAGLLNIDSEFDTRTSAELFVHSSPGTGGDLGQIGENGPGIFPVGAIGGRVRYQDNGWYGQCAVVEGIPGDPNDPYGITLTLDGDEGLFVIGELGHIWEDDEGELGKVALGAWGFTADFGTVLDPNAQASNRGAYLSLEKAFSREEDDASQGLTGYLRTGVADGRVNPLETFVGAGLIYTGPFDGRDEDQIGLGINAGFASEDFLDSGQFDRHETALELTYKFVVNENLAIQPDLQYIINPGFDPALDNALVLGLRAHVRFGG